MQGAEPLAKDERIIKIGFSQLVLPKVICRAATIQDLNTLIAKGARG